MPGVIAGAIGSAFFTAGASLAVVNAVTFGVYAVATVGIGVGLSALANALRPDVPRPPTIKPSNGQIVVREPVSPRIKSFGRVRLAGKFFFYDAEHVNGLLYHGVAFNHGRIGSFVEYLIDDNLVTIDISGNIETSPYAELTTAQIQTRLGLPAETEYSDIETDFGVADIRGDGVASMLVKLDNFADAETQNQNFPNGKPTIKVTIDSSVVWDCRDIAQSRTDKTTWEYRDNPVVCLLNYLIDPEGYGIPWAKIEPNLAEWTTAADICDESVTLAVEVPGDDGELADSEARYRLAITYQLTDSPKDVVARILRTFDGRCWVKRDGTIGIIAGEFISPSVTIPREHILSYRLTSGVDPLVKAAGVRAQYMSRQHNYREQDAEPWPNAAAVTALDEERPSALDLSEVPSFSQCRRLMKREYHRATAPYRGTIVTNLYGLKAIDERFINVELDELGIARTIVDDEGHEQIVNSFEVTGFRLDTSQMQCEIDIVAVDETIDDWDETTEEGTAPTLSTDLGYRKWVSKDEGELIGNVTSGGGLAAVFDENRSQSTSASASRGASTGYAGKEFASPIKFSRAIVYGSNNSGFANTNGTTTVSIRGEVEPGDAPGATGVSDGEELGSVTFTDTGDESAGRLVEWNGLNPDDEYYYVWALVSTPGASASYIAELDLWKRE